MAKLALLVARTDVVAAIRSGIQTSLGFDVSDWLASTPVRRSGDTPGTTSHRVAHGRIPDALWDDLVQILDDATTGVRDAVSWQGQGGGTLLANARWAIATDAGDLVAGYYLTTEDASDWDQPSRILEAAGLVLTASDADDGI